MTRRTGVPLAIVGLLGALALGVLGFSVAALLRAPGIGRQAPASGLPVLGTAPDFSLTSERGEVISRESYRGVVWIADFVFVRCGGTCPILSSRMAELSRQLRSEPRIQFVSFDVDPENDTVEKLAEYGRGLGADPARWRFLRGERPVIRSLVREGFQLGLEEEPGNATEPILHSTRFLLVDAEGRVRGSYDALDSARLIAIAADARALVLEAHGRGE